MTWHVFVFECFSMTLKKKFCSICTKNIIFDLAYIYKNKIKLNGVIEPLKFLTRNKGAFKLCSIPFKSSIMWLQIIYALLFVSTMHLLWHDLYGTFIESFKGNFIFENDLTEIQNFNKNIWQRIVNRKCSIGVLKNEVVSGITNWSWILIG